jgi:hypothetical protein
LADSAKSGYSYLADVDLSELSSALSAIVKIKLLRIW